MSQSLLHMAARGRSLRARLADERGDVPGWVLVTLMTAGLVTAVWLVADGQLTTILTRALNNVAAI